MTPHEQRAWERLTADMEGGMHQYDHWQDVAEHVRQIYLDRILLEDAARAAGIELIWSTEPGWAPKLKGQRTQSWNPLTDDGDALRLAIKLHIDLQFDDRPGFVTTLAIQPQSLKVCGAQEPTHENAESATRRAIVLTAAALA